MEKKKLKVLFSDLDGTLINTLSGAPFPSGIWDMRLRFDVLDQIKAIKPDMVAIVTNQGGIDKGFVDERDFVKGKMAYICRAIHEYTGCLCDFQYCSSNFSGCMYRKPNTGMLDTFQRKIFSQVGIQAEKDEMMMIGDASGKEGQFSDSDMKTAMNFGIAYMDVEDFIKLKIEMK